MAKDPAFLFYPNDWMGGTMTLTRHQRGCYMDLLIAQFNNGPLSLETIKSLLGSDQGSWSVLQKKFKEDSEGNFYNERLAEEIDKRKNYSESRRQNRSKPNTKVSYDTSHDVSYVTEVIPHMEDRNENVFNKEEVQRIFAQNGGTSEMADQFFNKHSSTGWVLNNSKIKHIAPLISNYIVNWNKNNQKQQGTTTPATGLTLSEKPRR